MKVNQLEHITIEPDDEPNQVVSRRLRQSPTDPSVTNTLG